jgi:hypothetical protein
MVHEKVRRVAPLALVLVMDVEGNELVAQKADKPFVLAFVTDTAKSPAPTVLAISTRCDLNIRSNPKPSSVCAVSAWPRAVTRPGTSRGNSMPFWAHLACILAMERFFTVAPHHCKHRA